MAVERLTDYTRRLWTALDADAPEDYDIQVGDAIYYMDSSQCAIVTYVYPTGSIDVEFLPDIGGGQTDHADEILQHTGPATLTTQAVRIYPKAFERNPVTRIRAPQLRYITDAAAMTTSGDGSYAFAYSGLTRVAADDMPVLYSMGTGGYQFAYCTALTSIHLPRVAMGSYVCYHDTALLTAVFPHIGNTLTSSNGHSFEGCTLLHSVDLGGGIQRIHTSDFVGCTHLTTLVIRKTSVPSLTATTVFNNTPFASSGTGGTLYVPQALIASYQEATNWSTILAYDNNQILPIEGSIYETQYVDGEEVPA